MDHYIYAQAEIGDPLVKYLFLVQGIEVTERNHIDLINLIFFFQFVFLAMVSEVPLLLTDEVWEQILHAD